MNNIIFTKITNSCEWIISYLQKYANYIHKKNTKLWFESF